MTALQHLGGDRWRTGIYVGRDRNGHQIRRTRAFRAADRREATAIAEAIRTDLRHHQAEAEARAGTFGGYVDDWLAECATRLAVSTMEGYRIQSAKAVARFGRWTIADIGRPDVRRWYAELLADGTTPATLAHIHSVLRMILRQANADGLTPHIATFKIPRPPVGQRRYNLPTNDRIHAAIDACPTDLLVAATLAGHGLRRGEVARARWADLTGSDLHVRGTKTAQSTRTITLGHNTMRALARQRRRQVTDAARLGHTIALRDPDRYIVAQLEYDPTGHTPYDPAWITRTWRRIADSAGVTGMHFHDLRHWAASRLLTAGHEPTEVAEHLGHTKVTTTLNIYSQVLDKSARRRARAKTLDG